MPKEIKWPDEVKQAQQFIRDACILREDEKWSKEEEWKYIRDNFEILTKAFQALIDMVEKQQMSIDSIEKEN